MFCCVIPGLFSFPGGALQFIPFYHLFHDNFDVHTETCVMCLVAVYALIIWTSDRNPGPEARLKRIPGKTFEAKQINMPIMSIINDSISFIRVSFLLQSD